MATRIAGFWRRGATRPHSADSLERGAGSDGGAQSEEHSDTGVKEDPSRESSAVPDGGEVDADGLEVESDSDAVESEGDKVESDSDESRTHASKSIASSARAALVFGVIAVAALGAGTGWYGYRAHQDREAAQTRAKFIQVAKQGALNLTTIDFHNVDADVQQILNSSTGTFLNDFQSRSAGFVDFVKKVQSNSFGKIVDAGMEAQGGNEARVLVQLAVTTSTAGAPPDPTPRSWRMRITVTNVGDDVKVSNVEFVP